MIKRRFKIVVLVGIICIFSLLIKQTVYCENKDENVDATQVINKSAVDFDLFAKSACLIDADTGRVLVDKNATEKLPMASTTKIMTCIVALENGNLDDLVTVSHYASIMPDVQLNIRENEQYYLKDLLHSLMLESHNDSAVAIAEHIGGTVEGFASMMNKKAKEIGCNNTYFITPNGLDATDDNGEHSTTAVDLSRIMAYCIKKSPEKDRFLEITQTANYSFSNQIKNEDGTISRGSRSFSCYNHNAFLNMMDGALSGKTGFTGNAGYCYVGALEKDKKTFIVALLACGWPNNKTYKWSDTKKLMNYGLNNYEYRTFDAVTIDESRLKPVTVEYGQTMKIGEVAKVDIIVGDTSVNSSKKCDGLLMREEESITLSYDVPVTLQAPVLKGQAIGSIKYKVDGQIYKEIPLIVSESIDKIDFKWVLHKVLDQYLP